MKFCKKCKQFYPEMFKYCPHCGNRVVDDDRERNYCYYCKKRIPFNAHFCPFCGFEQIVDGEFDSLDESLRKTLLHIKDFFSTRHIRSDADYFKNIIDNALWLWRKEFAKETDWAQKNALRYLAKTMLKDKHLIADYNTTNMRAQYILGVIYEYGLLDVKKDLDLALDYLHKSAAQNYSLALYELSLLTNVRISGNNHIESCPLNLNDKQSEALMYLRLAAEQGFKVAREELIDKYRNNIMKADRGENYYELGLIFGKGLYGMKPDPTMAKSFLTEASRLGSNKAFSYIKADYLQQNNLKFSADEICAYLSKLISENHQMAICWHNELGNEIKIFHEKCIQVLIMVNAFLPTISSIDQEMILKYVDFSKEKPVSLREIDKRLTPKKVENCIKNILQKLIISKDPHKNANEAISELRESNLWSLHNKIYSKESIQEELNTHNAEIAAKSDELIREFGTYKDNICGNSTGDLFDLCDNVGVEQELCSIDLLEIIKTK